jgi:hypothetical protein
MPVQPAAIAAALAREIPSLGKHDDGLELRPRFKDRSDP